MQRQLFSRKAWTLCCCSSKLVMVLALMGLFLSALVSLVLLVFDGDDVFEAAGIMRRLKIGKNVTD